MGWRRQQAAAGKGKGRHAQLFARGKHPTEAGGQEQVDYRQTFRQGLGSGDAKREGGRDRERSAGS